MTIRDSELWIGVAINGLLTAPLALLWPPLILLMPVVAVLTVIGCLST